MNPLGVDNFFGLMDGARDFFIKKSVSFTEPEFSFYKRVISVFIKLTLNFH